MRGEFDEKVKKSTDLRRKKQNQKFMGVFDRKRRLFETVNKVSYFIVTDFFHHKRTYSVVKTNSFYSR